MKHFSKSVNQPVPGKKDVERLTPNQASCAILKRLEVDGVETAFDRFEMQLPQCGYGQRGCCCRMCQWGPCRIDEKRPRGVCGRDANSVVFSNLLRGVAAGLAAHGRHAHEVILAVIAAAKGKMPVRLHGETRLHELAGKFGLDPAKSVAELAEAVARVLLDDLGRLTAEPLRTLAAFAPAESRASWEKLGLLPRSASYEIMEALHMTTLGGCSDWTALAEQELRSVLAYCYSALYGSSFATEILYGIPEPRETAVNYGILKADHVNVLVHGHSPVMVEEFIKKVDSPEVRRLVEKSGAAGIVVGGMCCTGAELLGRYGVPTVTNILGQELAIGTGAVDALVVDMQCVIPGLKGVADCYGTEIITTSNSNRIPGAVHIPFDPERPERMEDDALRIAETAVAAFTKRDRSRILIPSVTTRAKGGWSYEAILKVFCGPQGLVKLFESGALRGLVTIVGCNTVKVPYEYNHVTLARRLIQEGVLLTTTGCCAHALLNAGLCSPEAAGLAPPRWRETLLRLDLPPVLTVGGCVDNIRSLRLFIAVAEAAGRPLKEMPYLFVGPEPGNEKALGQAVTFMMHGVSALVGFPGQVPVPLPGETRKSDVIEFLAGDGLWSKVGARMITESNPEQAAQKVINHLNTRRALLGWD